MFAQVIKGKAKDAEALKTQLQKWADSVKQGAEGFLGSTAGVAADGTFIVVARFESEDAARKNSDRDEQGQWWAETEALIENPTFQDCTEVDEILSGGSNDAGFVQVMQGGVGDKEKVRELGRELEPQLRQNRPDVLGGIVAWHGGGNEFTQVTYFTSEQEAREREANPENQGPPEEWQNLFSEIEYIDLSDPILI